MNTRIEDLAKQAQEFAEYTTPQGLEWFPVFKQKFAELIINECTSVCDEVQDQRITYTASTIKQRIKDKFGVK